MKKHRQLDAFSSQKVIFDRMNLSKRFCGLSLLTAASFAATALLSLGCATTMETGYQPRALNDNSTARRGYYASSFTPAAEAAAKDRNADQRDNRPTFNGGGY